MRATFFFSSALLALPLAAGYATLFTPRAGGAASPFSAADLVAHATGVPADDAFAPQPPQPEQCPAA